MEAFRKQSAGRRCVDAESAGRISRGAILLPSLDGSEWQVVGIAAGRAPLAGEDEAAADALREGGIVADVGVRGKA